MPVLVIALRRLADARTATVALAALALVTAFLFALAPRVVDRESDSALRSTMTSAASNVRNLTLVQQGRIASGGADQLAIVTSSGDLLERQFPAPVEALVQGRYAVTDSARYLPSSKPIDGVTVRLRTMQGVGPHLRIAEGRLPTGRTRQVTPSSAPPSDLPVPIESGDVPYTLFEVAVSRATADALQTHVGETIVLRNDASDPLGRRGQYLGVEIVGLFDVVDPEGDYWFDDRSLEKPQIRSLSLLNQIYDTTVLMSPDAYGALMTATAGSGASFGYSWRYTIDTSRLRAATAPALLDGARRLESTFPSGAAPSSDTTTAALRTGLLGILRQYFSGWRSVEQILSAAAVGCAAVALLAMVLVGLLAAGRRSRSIAIWRSRGASRAQVTAAALGEAALVLAVPAAAGAALASVAIPDGPLTATIAFAAAVAVLAAVHLVALSQAALAAPSGPTGAGDAGGAGAGAFGAGGSLDPQRAIGRRRLVGEAALIALAVAGAYLLRQRGVAPASSATVLQSADPFIAAVPALVGAAAGLLVARALPVPLRLVGRLAERRRSLVGALAFRRSSRAGGNATLLVALLAMAAVGAFASVSLVYLDRGAEAASWQTVGAPFRVISREGTLPGDFDAARLPGVRATAPTARLAATVPGRAASLTLLATDVLGYRDVLAGSGQEGTIPAALLAEAGNGAGTGSGARSGAARVPVPALVSTAFAATAGMRPGSTFDLTMGGAFNTYRVVAIQPSFPTLGPGLEWVVIPTERLAPLRSPGTLAPTEVFVRAEAADGPALTEALSVRLAGAATLQSRGDVDSDLRGSPYLQVVIFGLAALALVAVGYGALAIVCSAAVGGAARAREVAHLRVLGLTRRDVLRLAALERAPAALLVVVAGAALGVGLFVFLRPALGLDALIGLEVDLGLPLEPAQLGALAGAIAIVVSLAVGIEAAVESSSEPAGAIRKGLQ